MDFTYEINDSSGVQVITFQGKLMDKELVEKLLNEVENEISSGHSTFLLDLAELEYMNSTGLNTLINILTKARNAGGEAVIANISESINELLITTKLTSVFNVAEDAEQALTDLQARASEPQT